MGPYPTKPLYILKRYCQTFFSFHTNTFTHFLKANFFIFRLKFRYDTIIDIVILRRIISLLLFHITSHSLIISSYLVDNGVIIFIGYRLITRPQELWLLYKYDLMNIHVKIRKMYKKVYVS